MIKKFCVNCKWYRPENILIGLCLNPLNDKVYNHFNASTGDTVFNIRTMASTLPEQTCDEFERYQKKVTKNEEKNKKA